MHIQHLQYGILWNASVAKARRIYIFLLQKPVKEQFSKGSEAVVPLSVVLSGLPVAICPQFGKLLQDCIHKLAVSRQI